MPTIRANPTCCGSLARTGSEAPKRVTVFVPLHDTNPLKSIDYQYVTVSLIVLNIAIYLIFQTGWFIPLDEENLAAAR